MIHFHLIDGGIEVYEGELADNNHDSQFFVVLLKEKTIWISKASIVKIEEFAV